ncbi:MAG: acyl carrier protein [Acidobacteriota bacterium]|nr:acyl carrier protein [Acidobacteriota bacterium]
MSDARIYEMIKDIFVEFFEQDESKVRPEATLFEDLGLDSLDMVDLAVELQSRFGFTFDRTADEEKIRSIRTVQNFCDYVEEKAKALNIKLPER